jgi:RHS repeat-associated protein
MAIKQPPFRRIALHLLTVAIFFIAAPGTFAQNANDKGTPAESKPGQSTQSTYARDKIETVNLVNGNMSLQIPLVTIGGRGSAGYTIALSYNSKLWSPEHETELIPQGMQDSGIPPEKVEHYRATFDDIAMRDPYVIALGSGWTVLPGPNLKTRKINIDPILNQTCATHQNEESPSCGYRYVLTRAWLILPDGSEIEMRDNLTDGAPAVTVADAYGYHWPTDRDRGRVWHSTDGSNITFASDQGNGVVNGNGGGWVFLPDGTRFHLGSTLTKIIDRNGNFISIDSAQNPGYWTYTDELGRQVLLTSGGSNLTIIVKGYNGVADRTITVDTGSIGGLGVPINLRADFRSLQRPFYSGDYQRTYSQGDVTHTDPNPHTDLFSGSENPDRIDQHSAVTALHLLDGRNFVFQYNQYGELAQIIYPGGGVSQIDYSGVGTSLCEAVPYDLAAQLNRQVVRRRSLADGVNVDAVSSYNRTFGSVDGVQYPSMTIETRQGSSTGTLLASETHYYLMRDAEYRYCGGTTGNGNGTAYEKWQNGKEFRVESSTGNGTQIVKRTWVQRADVVWANDVGVGYDAYVASGHGQEQPPNDPRVTVEDTILENGRMKRVNYDYDNFNNVIAEREYDFGDTSGSLGSLVRQTFRAYGVNNGSNYGTVINGLCYSNLNPTDSSCGSGIAADVSSIIYQHHLLLSETVKDAGDTQAAYSEFEYDNYNSDTNHAAIVSNSGMIQYDGTQFSPFSTTNQPRGNVTKASRWAGGSNYIDSYSQYDNAGNVVWTKDPNGKVTTVSYVDNFGDGSNPDSGGGGPNGATFGLATLATNALGHQAKTQFDYTRGVPTGAKHPNGTVFKTEYDLIGRPVRATAAVGLAEQTISEITYPTASSNVSTASKQMDATRWLASKTVMDGFDRVITAWQAEDGQHANSANFTIRASTVYDALGRVSQVSNPYRPASETAVYTTTAYDLAGRVVSVTTPDNAVVNSFYNGNQVLVKDQAGKERMSLTNGLGELTDIWEITAADDATESITFPNHSEVAAGYRTKYEYDTLGNLITVTQRKGTSGAIQTRTFAYDSLKRLTSAANPESGTISYQYDNNGNLTQKTDARGIVSTYLYDALNRNYSIIYTNDPANTPAVARTYDNPTSGAYGIGRLWTQTAGDMGTLTKIDSFDAMGRPLTQWQQFYANGNWSDSYTVSATYDKAGHLLTETYPSGHQVAYNYDAAGRLADKVPGSQTPADLAFSGNLGDGATRTYATALRYDAASRMLQEGFGTSTPLYHKQHYNIRGQLYDVRLSSLPGDEWDWNRGAVVSYYSSNNVVGGSGADNNGNLRRSEIFIPNDDQINSYSFMRQDYTYDSLNRLTAVAESANGTTPSFAQSYSYDRWGNRTINTQNNATWGAGSNSIQATIDPGSNRLYAQNDTSHALVDYDAAGNQTKDYLTSNGTRAYDAENRMISAADSSNHTSTYCYDGDGHRVKRSIAGQPEVWQVYGFGGELLAEYSANTAASSPQKEYGYRNGELLITADAATAPRTNYALASNGATASASSILDAGFAASGAINGDRKGANWGNGGGWADVSYGTFPDWLEVDFNGSKSISEIDVFTVQDNWASPAEPTEAMTFSAYGQTAYDVQYWNGSSWVTVSGGSITNNNKIWRKLTFAAISTSKIRVLTNASIDNGYSHLTEVEAWGGSGSGSSTAQLHWLVTDQLGTPRMVFDQSGSLANVSRHDYLPFGEELFAGQGSRTQTQGYTLSDNVRQKFTQKERDNETGLDYFKARYYGSTQGRFTSPDPIFISDQQIVNPQSWNLYSYVGNNPLCAIDPTGMTLIRLGRSDDDIDNDLNGVNAELKQKGLSKDQKRDLNQRKGELELEKQGNAFARAEIKRLQGLGAGQNLKVSDFTLSTDPKKDFGAGSPLAARIGDEAASAAGKQYAGDVFFTATGFSEQVFINTTSPNTKEILSSGSRDPDLQLFAGSIIEHERFHLGDPKSNPGREERAYEYQKKLLDQWGPGAFVNKTRYQGYLDLLNQRIKENQGGKKP